MRLNTRLLSLFFPFAFIFGAMAFMVSPQVVGKLMGVCAGVFQALAFTALAWKLGINVSDEGFYFPWVTKNKLVFVSWIVLIIVSSLVAMDLYVGWTLLVLEILSLICFCSIRTLRMSKQWVLIGDGSTFVLNPPGKGIELFWWEEPIELSVIPKEKKVPLSFAMLAEVPLGLQVDMLTTSCRITFIGGYNQPPTKTYRAAVADIAAELSEEIQACISASPTTYGQYSFAFPFDLFSVEGRTIDRFGYRVKASLLHTVGSN